MIARSCGSISAVFCNALFIRTGISNISPENSMLAARERIKRLIINVPPRSLKSVVGSIAQPAWWLGHDPSAQIIAVSYAQDPSDKLTRDCRTLMQSTWYQSLFATRLSSERKAVGEFVTTKAARGWRLRPQGTGRGADVIII